MQCQILQVWDTILVDRNWSLRMFAEESSPTLFTRGPWLDDSELSLCPTRISNGHKNNHWSEPFGSTP